MRCTACQTTLHVTLPGPTAAEPTSVPATPHPVAPAGQEPPSTA